MHVLPSSILPSFFPSTVKRNHVTLTSLHISFIKYPSSNFKKSLCIYMKMRKQSYFVRSLCRVRRFSSRVNTITRVSYRHIFHLDSSSPTLCTNRIINRFKSRIAYSSARKKAYNFGNGRNDLHRHPRVGNVYHKTRY